LLGRASLIVEGIDALPPAGRIGDDEAHTRIKLAEIPFDLRYHPAGYLPALRLIAKTDEVAAPRRAAVSPPSARAGIRSYPARPGDREPDSIADNLGFAKLVRLGVGVSPRKHQHHNAPVKRGTTGSSKRVGAVLSARP